MHGNGAPKMLAAPGTQLCYACHDVSWASRPATYSYEGSSTFGTSAHASLDTTAGAGACAVCHAVHGSTVSVDGTTAPGMLGQAEGTLCTGSGSACHAVAAGSVAGVSVFASFEATTDDTAHHDVMPGAQGRTGSRLRCSDCHEPHRETRAQRFSDPERITSSMTTGFGRFVNESGQVWALVGAEHDGNGPLISAESLDTSAGTGAPAFTWTTNEAATTWIDWGATTGYELGSFGTTLPLTTAHLVQLSGVDTATPTYHYRIRSADALGNQTVTADRQYAPGASVIGTPTQVAPAQGSTVYWTTSSVNVTFQWNTVTVSDGHAPVYTLEFTRTWGIYQETRSVDTLASTLTTRVPGANSSISWRVKARDSVHPTASTPFTSPWTFYLSYPDEGMAPFWGGPRLFAQETMLAPPATVPDEAIQVAVAEPEAPSKGYSLDTDRIAIELRRGDGPAATRGPSAGWSSFGPEIMKPVPVSPGDADAGSLAATGTPDGAYWTTDMATADRAWNWQVSRFNLTADDLASARELALSWAGHGEPTTGYHTVVYLWDSTTSSWESVSDSSAVGSDAVAAAKTSPSVPDAFCLRCHDATPPPGVTVPAGLTQVASAWTTATGDVHGAAAGTGSGGLAPGYSRGSSAIACVACHDPHGGSNTFHFNEWMNGSTQVSVTGGPSSRALCASCHQGTVADWHRPCATCHDAVVSGHAPTEVPVYTPDEASDCLSCHRHGSSTWDHQACLGCHSPAEAFFTGQSAPLRYRRF